MLALEPVLTTQPTRLDAIESLRTVMREEARFVKVHAAEALIELGEPDGIQVIFLAEELKHRDVNGYRLGVWRILSRLTAGTPEQDRWLQLLRKAALDPASPDRIAAIESLAKIKYVPAADERPIIESIAAADSEGIALFSIWLLSHVPGSVNPQEKVASYLRSTDPISRLRAIYILRFLPDLSEATRSKITLAARSEPKGTLTHAYATSSSYLIAGKYGDHAEAARARAELLSILKEGEPAEKQEACRALGEGGSSEDIEAITQLLADAAAPARVGAALAIAKLVK